MPPLKSFTSLLTTAQAARLRELLEAGGFEFSPKPYTLYFAQKNKLSIAVYEKGPKVVVQGRETEDFVKFRLEPEVLGEAKLGYDEVLHPDRFAPHFGIDESGKGDFFGPLVVAGAFVDGGIARALADAGVQDSKRISSDARIRALAKSIRETRGLAHNCIVIGPEKYNELIGKMGNVNKLLAWGHARVIENLLDARPDCPRALSDQFGNPALIRNALLKRGREIQLDQRTKAESDPAVAAASILAREKFIDWMDHAGAGLGAALPRGASARVKEVARELVGKQSPAVLGRLAKTHFRTAWEVAPDAFPEPPKRDPGAFRRRAAGS